MKPSPPNRALKFLRWFCREDYIEEIEGDLTEVFEKRCEESPTKAKWKFIWSVFRYFRPEFIKSFKRKQTLNYTAMFRHNFLLTYRTFKRYKMSFFINLIGLSTGLASALLIYLWVNDELSVDKFHEKDDRLYQVMENMESRDGLGTSDQTSGPVAKALADEMPEVEYAAAVIPPTTRGFDRFVLTVRENNIKATGQYVGKDYFNIFSYGIIYGDADQVLSDKNSIVISEELALKLFNTTEGVVGEAIEFQHEREFLISGIFRKIPTASSVQFDFALSFETFGDTRPTVLSWYDRWPRAFVVLREGTDVNQFNEKIADFLENKTNGDITYRKLFLTSYSDFYLYGNYENGVQSGGRIEYVRLFSIIALFILIIACINFMNLSTAKAATRIKEVGVKKTLGAGRISMAIQYLGESMLMTILSLVAALVLVKLFLPQFNIITGKQLALTFDGRLVVSLLCIILFTGLIGCQLATSLQENGWKDSLIGSIWNGGFLYRQDYWPYSSPGLQWDYKP